MILQFIAHEIDCQVHVVNCIKLAHYVHCVWRCVSQSLMHLSSLYCSYVLNRFTGYCIIILGNGLKPEGGLKGSVNYPENFPRMYEHPTLNDLLSLEKQDGEPIRIIERISAQYYELGTYLLNDNHGAVMKTIKENASGKVEAINREILTRWINGQGIEERDWKTLVQALREGPKLNTLADDIVAALDQ